MCRLRRSSAQTISNYTYTDIDFNAEDYDVGSIGDITTDHRIEIRRDGYYQITGAWTTNAVMDDNEQVAAYIAVNGTTYVRGMEISGGTNWYLSANCTITLELSAGDYVDFVVWQGEGASQTTNTTLGNQPTLQIAEIR
ncbi:MAG: hypothetical protein H6585_08350 [Flavobacteriales bacterium]|nr:hypothetical protein [Flavobacteriales bacterium]MCB9448339.1 hypothetical protein [Flavobacteriales bacterium]